MTSNHRITLVEHHATSPDLCRRTVSLNRCRIRITCVDEARSGGELFQCLPSGPNPSIIGPLGIGNRILTGHDCLRFLQISLDVPFPVG